ncbi:MAG: hypothetical protein ACOYKE_12725 [Ferruginibacter sp.]
MVKDSVNGYTILGNQIYLNKNNNTFLATRKPILIFKGDGNDSTFIAADTLFSGLKSKDSIGNLTLTGNIDTLQQAMVIDLADSTQRVISPNDSTQKKSPISILNSTTKSANSDTIRYFQAFHHVRIFNDSLQSVCDSLYYSSEDSVFRLFNDPLVFANNSQIAGDTIFIFSKNRKAERVYVFENAILVNKANDQMFNQISGRTINGYFKDGNIDYMRSKGSPAESVFYPQDDDSAYIGMNRSKGDVIDVYFLNKEVHKVKFVNDVDGTLYPIRQIPEDQKFLKKYSWQDARRPKHKLELFE